MKRRTATAISLAKRCARTIDDAIGTDTLVLDVRKRTPVADYMVITTATSPPHMKAIREAVEESLDTLGRPPHHVEGNHESSWLLIDCLDVIIHVFRETARRYYDLERLWGDARRVAWKPAGGGGGKSAPSQRMTRGGRSRR